MTRYLIKRVGLSVLTIFIISAITFFAMNAIPGGPFNSEKALSESTKQVLMERYGLDKPLMEQFVTYIGNALQGEFGVSIKTGRDISTTISESFAISAKIGLMAVILSVFLGIILGSTAALLRNRWPDRLIIFLTTLCTAVPSFILGTMLLYIFSIQLGWVEAWSANSTNYVLPVIALAMYPTAYITKLTKTSMLDSLGQDYIRTAKAKGVPTWKVIFKHGLRNALIPVVTYVGPMTAYILVGSLVVENIFTIGGLGSKFITAINNRDYPMIMATTIFLSCIMVVMSLLSDIVYKIVDPRIKFD